MLRHSGPQCVCSYIFRAGNANVCFRPHFFKLDAADLKNSTDVATYHVALEATEHHVESDDTFDKATNVRECVTLKLPGKIELGDKHKVWK